MGTKLFFTGLAMALLLPLIVPIPALAIAGAVVGILGIFLMWFDK